MTTKGNALSAFALALTVAQFCEAHNITKVFFYKLLKTGRGPRIMKVGARTLVSVEAARDWRRQMEKNTCTNTCGAVANAE